MDASQELLLRGLAAGLFVGLAVVIGRPRWSAARVTSAIFALAAAAHTVTQLDNWVGLLGPLLTPLAWCLSVAAPGLFWSMAVTIFADRRERSWILLLPSTLLLAIGLVAQADAGLSRLGWTAHSVISAALFAHALVVVWIGWKNDLVEARRKLRAALLVVASLYGAVVVLAQVWELNVGPLDHLSALAAVTLTLFALSGAAVFARPVEDLLSAPRLPTPSAATADPLVPRLAATLDMLMRQERLYRDEALSIAALAMRLDIPEYRLRRLINQRLGHRNFAAYLNGWRLDEAKLALADPEQRSVPISTIALDCGFGSLGPFNRAFKEATGMTPTAYRSSRTS